MFKTTIGIFISFKKMLLMREIYIFYCTQMPYKIMMIYTLTFLRFKIMSTDKR